MLSTVDNPAAPVQYDSELAKQIGQAELARMLPETSFNCEASGCARVGIDLTNGSAAEVSASYNLPITFPVNLLIGSDYVKIVHSAREQLEMPRLAMEE